MTTETERAKASDRQEAGNHYKDMPIQPAEFCQRNRLNWCEANVVKYVCRHRDKKGTEDIRKAIHYLELLLEWEYPCSIDRYAAIHTPLPPEEVERIIGEVAPLPLLCKTCGQEDCSTNRMNECEKYAQCARWIEKPASSLRERIAEAKEPQALDLSLPSITLPGDVDKVWMKYTEEQAEWMRSDPKTVEGLMELWDCIQVLQTVAERGGHGDHLVELYTSAAEKFLQEGKPVIEAKRAMLLKNAKRLRPTVGGDQSHGYYSPKVCAAIIASNGHRFA
jgi:hypothetical protein